MTDCTEFRKFTSQKNGHGIDGKTVKFNEKKTTAKREEGESVTLSVGMKWPNP